MRPCSRGRARSRAGGAAERPPGGVGGWGEEVEAVCGGERPALVETISWAAGNGDRSENGDYIYGRKKLREIDRRLAWLGQRMKAHAGGDRRAACLAVKAKEVGAGGRSLPPGGSRPRPVWRQGDPRGSGREPARD